MLSLERGSNDTVGRVRSEGWVEAGEESVTRTQEGNSEGSGEGAVGEEEGEAMSAKRYLPGTGGMYETIRKRGPAAGMKRYGLRLVVDGKIRCFDLGYNLDRAMSKRDQIVADPEGAMVKRQAKRERRCAGPVQAFDALVKSFLAGYHSRGDSGYYRHVAESWKNHFGKVPADRVTRAMVEDYRDTLRRDKYGDSTIRKYVGALGTCYRWAIGRGLLSVNPVQDVKRPAEPDREVTVLSRDEEAKLLKEADPQTRLVIEFYIASGMRVSEALDLRWPQVDRTGEAILINKSKTGKARSIPLNARLTAILDRATRHIRSDYVLRDDQGIPLDRFILARKVESALERAGVVKVKGSTFNLFRHTFGSRLAEKGYSFGAIAKLMGNSAAMCERHYIRFSPEHLKAMMASLDTPSAPHSAPGADRDANLGSEDRQQVIGA